jgi:hypothetical protein
MHGAGSCQFLGVTNSGLFMEATAGKLVLGYEVALLWQGSRVTVMSRWSACEIFIARMVQENVTFGTVLPPGTLPKKKWKKINDSTESVRVLKRQNELHNCFLKLQQWGEPYHQQ